MSKYSEGHMDRVALDGYEMTPTWVDQESLWAENLAAYEAVSDTAGVLVTENYTRVYCEFSIDQLVRLLGLMSEKDIGKEIRVSSFEIVPASTYAYPYVRVFFENGAFTLCEPQDRSRWLSIGSLITYPFFSSTGWKRRSPAFYLQEHRVEICGIAGREISMFGHAFNMYVLMRHCGRPALHSVPETQVLGDHDMRSAPILFVPTWGSGNFFYEIHDKVEFIKCVSNQGTRTIGIFDDDAILSQEIVLPKTSLPLHNGSIIDGYVLNLPIDAVLY